MLYICVIVPVYNRKNITIEGLKNLNQSIEHYRINGNSTLNIKVIVVDDGSTDGTSEWILTNLLDVKLLKSDGSLWWSGSINKGAKYALDKMTSSHVLLWNDDTICDISYFIELENALFNHAELAKNIIVSKIFWLDNKSLLFNFGCLFDANTGKKTIIGLNSADTFKEIQEVDWSGGMGTLIPANILREVNFLDDRNFPQYDGDLDFFLRAKIKGVKAFAVPTLIIYNNPDTTGIHKTLRLKELKTLLTSKKSLFNLKKNIAFNLRHANTPLSWFNLLKDYIRIVSSVKFK